jgi:hypothetical protein
MHMVQLHVSALENGHIQVVREINSKQLYETYNGLYTVGRKGGEFGTRSSMSHGVWELWVYWDAAIVVISEIIKVRSMVSYYVCCRNYMYIYILIIEIKNVQ